jgi:hypothetical protein
MPAAGFDASSPPAAWLQVLNIERASYLSQFESGKLGSEAFLEMEAFMATLNAKAAHTAGEQLSPMYDREFEDFLKRLLSSKDPRRLKVKRPETAETVKPTRNRPT